MDKVKMVSLDVVKNYHIHIKVGAVLLLLLHFVSYAPHMLTASAAEPAESQIVHGHYLNPAPQWMVAVQTSAGGSCSGTLIHSRWVLSAGHCGKATTVYLGGSHWAYGTPVNVQSSYILSTKTGNNDIALYKLASPVSNQTLPLNRDTNLLSHTPWVIGVGYGQTSLQTSLNGSLGYLHHTGWLQVTNRNSRYNSSFWFGGNANATVCFGDSGGPLVGWTPTGYVLAGVTSHGPSRASRECTARALSGGADVSENIGWIDNVMRGRISPSNSFGSDGFSGETLFSMEVGPEPDASTIAPLPGEPPSELLMEPTAVSLTNVATHDMQSVLVWMMLLLSGASLSLAFTVSPRESTVSNK